MCKIDQFYRIKYVRDGSSPKVPAGSAHLGFSLIELMVVVSIISILASVAVPSYLNYSKNGEISTALTTLVNLSTRMEKHLLDYRTYEGDDGCAVSAPGSDNFSFSCNATPDTYTWTAASTDSKFKYTIDHSGNKQTEKVDGKSSSESCWVFKEDGACY